MITKILLIEDEVGLRQSLSLMLTVEGYDVMSAEDGSIGVNLARIEVPDVVICDLKMPRLNGDEVFDLLSHDPRTQEIPFILISAEDLDVMPEPIKGLGTGHFLQKPFSRNDLLEAIARNQKISPLATKQFNYTHTTEIQPQHCPC